MTKDGNEMTLPAPKWMTCNGGQLRKLALAGLAWLEKNHQHVNSLNVFPVPDGDTGTNMLLTMRAAYKRVQSMEDMHVGRVAAALSQGALMGARGNSGVILSQIWRGLARSLEGKETFNATDLAQAFVDAADTAYKGVMKPVEGTILTVIREASVEAVDAARKNNDLRFVLERSLERAQLALERTPDLLPVLKQAGVVDSGGQGLVYILEGMLRYTTGDRVGMAEPEPAGVPSEVPVQALVAPAEGLDYPYDVQFILVGRDLDVMDVRNRINAMGDSTVVVGDESTIKVHVHVRDPGKPLSLGAALGIVTDVVVENMQVQVDEIVGHNHAAVVAGPSAAVIHNHDVTVEPGQIAVIAVAPGDGLAQVFKSLGVANVVRGGQTNNPSTEEILKAIEDLPTDKVVILPNNKNIVMAAKSARDLCQKQVVVVPTRTVPQGISALFALQPEGDLDEVAAAMESATGDVASGEITYATRSVSLDGVDVKEGNFISIADGRLCAAAETLEAVLPPLLDRMEVAERELVSVYYGQDVSADEAEAFAGSIQAICPDIEIELVAGGQPYYYYILGAE